MKETRINTETVYKNYYQTMMHTGLVGKIFQISNRMIEKNFNDSAGGDILELAATNFHHLLFVKQVFDSYTVSDIDISAFPKELPSKVKIRKIDATNLNKIESDSFDRIIVTCLVVHLGNLDQVLPQWRRVLKKGGHISIYVHCEPGILIRLSRFLTTRRVGKKFGYDHLSIVYSNHITHYLAVKNAIKHCFEGDRIQISAFPSKFFSWNFNLWKIFTIQKL
jgi:SAM-dependent methyltransferase